MNAVQLSNYKEPLRCRMIATDRACEYVRDRFARVFLM